MLCSDCAPPHAVCTLKDLKTTTRFHLIKAHSTPNGTPHDPQGTFSLERSSLAAGTDRAAAVVLGPFPSPVGQIHKDP